VNDEQAPQSRRFPSTVGGACYLLMLLFTLAGVLVTGLVDWRLGIRIVGGSLLGLAALRLVTPAHQAGMLAVRARGTDVVLLVIMGVALIVLAGSIPDQPAIPVRP
jgi:hypothetical protein